MSGGRYGLGRCRGGWRLRGGSRGDSAISRRVTASFGVVEGDGEVFGVEVEVLVGGEDGGGEAVGDSAEEEVYRAALDAFGATCIGICGGQFIVRLFSWGKNRYGSNII